MKKRDKKPDTVKNGIVINDNCTIINNGKISIVRVEFPGTATIVLCIIVASLAISHCYPELLPVFIRWVVGTVWGI